MRLSSRAQPSICGCSCVARVALFPESATSARNLDAVRGNLRQWSQSERSKLTAVWRLFILIAAIAACAGLLLHQYPWAIYYGNFNFSFEMTFASYLIVTSILGSTVAVAVFLPLHKSLTGPASALIAGVIIFGSNCLLALLFGPGSADIPHTRVRGIFFSEWKFMTYIGTVALPVTLLSAALMWLGKVRLLRRTGVY